MLARTLRGMGKRVVALFSGGDAAGMNPCLRALVRHGLNAHDGVILGVKDGYRGLVQICERIREGRLTAASLVGEVEAHWGLAGLARRTQRIVAFDHAAVSGLSGRPGIVLGAARSPEFHDVLIRKQVVALLDELEADALVVCGGNGSLAGARALSQECSLPIIGIPATIDNDVAGSEMSLGVDTAANTLIWVIQRFSDTAASHHRVMVLETMGRDSGALTRLAGLAVGAEIVVTPERGTLDRAKIVGIGRRLEGSLRRGREHAIVLVAEGVALAPELGGDLAAGPPSPAPARSPALALADGLRAFFRRPESPFAELEIRASVLGHLQRGGSPTAADRILAARFAEASWEAIMEAPPRSGALQLAAGRVRLRQFPEAEAATSQPAPEALYHLQKSLSKW